MSSEEHNDPADEQPAISPETMEAFRAGNKRITRATIESGLITEEFNSAIKRFQFELSKRTLNVEADEVSEETVKHAADHANKLADIIESNNLAGREFVGSVMHSTSRLVKVEETNL